MFFFIFESPSFSFTILQLNFIVLMIKLQLHFIVLMIKFSFKVIIMYLNFLLCSRLQVAINKIDIVNIIFKNPTFLSIIL